MSKLRGFQQDLKLKASAAFLAGAVAVMLQLSTGGGKTVIMGDFARDHAAAPHDPRFPGGCAIAHRNELVGQMSVQLAREGVVHDIIAPQKIIKGIVAEHMEKFGRSFYNARAAWRVAGVKTILGRASSLKAWCQTVGLIFIDEAHHVLRDNQWGKAAALFPNARVLLPTATPIRADRAGLGRHADGIADALVEGPPMRWLIDNAYLTDYKVYTIPASDLMLDGVKVGASGEFNMEQLREAVHNSEGIVGDVVETYIKYAHGKLGVTFATDVRHAQDLTAEYNRRGVPAVMLTADDDPDFRRQQLRKFRNREIWQLVNVDLFGEGFDLPAIECVSFARPTASFSLYAQQWGRALRLMAQQHYLDNWDAYSVEQRLASIAASEKPFAYIFDHVGNFYRHEGPPDKPRVWSLHGTGSAGGGGGGIPMRVCLATTCAKPYERIYPACPYCGTAAPEPVERGTPKAVDGDITQVDPAWIAQMMREAERLMNAPVVPYGVPRMAVVANHMNRQRAQHHLRELMGWWAGTYNGDVDRVNYRRFYLTFNVDVMTAKTLNEKDATTLHEKILADMTNRGIILPATITNALNQQHA